MLRHMFARKPACPRHKTLFCRTGILALMSIQQQKRNAHDAFCDATITINRSDKITHRTAKEQDRIHSFKHLFTLKTQHIEWPKTKTANEKALQRTEQSHPPRARSTNGWFLRDGKSPALEAIIKFQSFQHRLRRLLQSLMQTSCTCHGYFELDFILLYFKLKRRNRMHGWTQG